MQTNELPRVTYTNIGADFSGLHAMLDEAIPAFRAKLGGDCPNLIGGEPSSEGQSYVIRSPIDSQLVLGTAFAAGRAEMERAVGAARAAFPAWSRTPWQERLRVLDD